MKINNLQLVSKEKTFNLMTLYLKKINKDSIKSTHILLSANLQKNILLSTHSSKIITFFINQNKSNFNLNPMKPIFLKIKAKKNLKNLHLLRKRIVFVNLRKIHKSNQ